MATSRVNRWKSPIERVHSNLADNVRTARHAAGLTQDQLAEYAGLERKSINRIENNRLSPTIDTLAPDNGPLGGGTNVVVTGQNYEGVITVTVGGVVSPSVAVSGDKRTLNFLTPASAAVGPRDVVITSDSHGSVTRAGGTVKLYNHEEGGTLTELRLPHGSVRA